MPLAFLNIVGHGMRGPKFEQNVEDMQAALAFYVDVLGFKNADWGSEDFTGLARDGGSLYLSLGDQGRGGAWVWIGVDDVRPLYEDLKARGIPILMPPTNFPWALEMRVADIMLTMPTLFVAILLTQLLRAGVVPFLSAGIMPIVLVIAATSWMSVARLVRASYLSIKQKEFIEAARASGSKNFRLMLRHILPNAIQPLIVQASLGMAGAVLSEASLSFLGLGVPPPAPSWGVMIEEARDLSTLQAAPHALIFPGLAIALTVLAFNFIGDGLREYLDPRQRRR